jgi:hypothetical protein
MKLRPQSFQPLRRQRGFLLHPFRFGDPYFGSVTSLLHMDGANASTTFTDQTGRALTATNAVISTTQSKFGGASGSFNGTTAYLTGPTGDTGTSLAAADFTLEGWFYPTATPATAGDCFSTNNSSNGYVLRFLPGNQFRFDYSTLGNNTFSALHATAVTLNTWNHVAVVRYGTVITIYLAGVGGGTSTIGTTAIFTPSVQQLVLGRNPTNSSWYYSGYMDELRLTKGVARYTANFTPPTAPFPNS